MSNKAIETGVAAFNTQQEDSATAMVASAIRHIKDEQRKIEAYRTNIEASQEALMNVAVNGYTPESVFGGPIPEGPNKATMVKAIETMNAAAQERVAAITREHTQNINDAQNAIAACTARIAAMRKDASGTKAETTTVSEVMG